jgi:ribose-phosphate pyrophosphokinase
MTRAITQQIEEGEMILFCGRQNRELGQKITEYLGRQLGNARISEFPDGELLIKLEENVRGRDVFIIQPTCEPVNENLMELLIFIDCARRASAKRITAVIPYFGYARQDRKDEGRTPITAKLCANLITTAGADRVLVIDLHANQIQGFFDIPVDNLEAEPVLSKHFMGMGLDDLVVVSPDVGNVKTARIYANRLDGELAIIEKRRISSDNIETSHIIGNVEDMNVLMVDDIIATAGTITAAAELCRDNGAKSVVIGATHAVLCGQAIERLSDAPVDAIVVTDTIPISDEKRRALDKLEVLSISELIGEAINRIHNNDSVSSLFMRHMETK